MRSFGRVLLFTIVLPSATLGACIWFLLAMVGLAWTPFTCTTEVRGRVTGISGFDFEISETDCDTLAKEASISVFASRAGRREKTLLLKYGPAGVDELPVITSIGSHEVQIFIPRISDLIFMRETMPDLTVDYKIDVIEYPDNRGTPNG